MDEIILRAVSLTLVIAAGAALRFFRLVGGEAGACVKTILMYLTLPAAIVTNFSKIERLDGAMLLLILMGIAANLVMILAGACLTKSKSREEKAVYMNCLPAYNIGAFCLPFVQSFLPPVGSVTACLFDAGNSLMCTGGTYAIAAEYLSEQKKGIDFKEVGKRLFTSPPLVTYLVMIILSAACVRIPRPVLTLLSPAAAANPFVAMLMIGLLFRVELKRSYFLSIFKLVGLRHLFSFVMSLIYYFVLPFDLAVRQALVLVSFGPMSVVASVFTGKCGGDEGKASTANSVTIVCSVIEITGLLAVMGIYEAL